ncbi:MAG TPA: ribonuclease HII [Polyangia bacterium]|nr:ribonuclease HII [Polyangia bacterium]
MTTPVVRARLRVRVRPLPLLELRARYVDGGRPLPAEVEAALAADPRAGAQAILQAVARRRRDNRAEGQRLRTMLRFETALWTTGVTRIAGVDEAGMSPLAGPVAAAAVILAPGTRIPEVDDSKRLDAETRERLAPIIKQRAVAWAVAFAEVDEIDRLNIYWAGLSAMRRAIEALAPAAEHLLIDGRKLRDVALPQQRIVGGDAKSLSIAAASILAKTTRDARMRALDAEFPGYGFAQHKGYPVSAHARALKDLGACPVHRRSFALVREALGLPPLPPWPEVPPHAEP